ncbi:MAG: Crp/Fnr family transcriptional regulator [Prolixibacteraceae bacterium]|jgi:CRP-like cAMP-binding protein|nr:Crp/Fnr family transcriptional regulator [Prolixibacteraceae bacterium]
MGTNHLITAYNSTLLQLQEFFAKKSPCFLKKGEAFIDYGDPSGKLGIVLGGLLYSSYLSENGKEWISNFFYPPNHAIVTSYESFLRGRKSNEAIRAYEDSSLIFIHKEEFDSLVSENPQLEHMVRVMAEESYVQTLRRVYSFQSLNAFQRVKRFFSEHGELVPRVQRQHIASYLGIHRNIFTRVLSKL